MKRILFGLTMLIATQLLAETHQYDELFFKYSKQYNIPNGFLKQIAIYESGLDTHAKTVTSKGNEIGLFLINDFYHPEIKEDGFNPEVNIRIAARIANSCLEKYGKTIKTIECFNRYAEERNEVLLRILNTSLSA